MQDDHPYYGDSDYDDTNYLSDADPMPGGDSDGFYDEAIDDGIIESLVIIALAAALVFLIYYRQQHQLAHRRGEAARVPGGADDPAQPPHLPVNERGVFPAPGDPELNDWVAGGVGH